MKNYTLLLLFLTLAPVFVYAIPAQPGMTVYTQPDGTTVRVQLVGDEHFHYYLTEDNYLLAEDAGTLYFAEADEDGMPVASAFQATNAPLRSAEVNAFLSTVCKDEMLQAMAMRNKEVKRGPGKFVDVTFPTRGEQKAVVILVEYQDVKFRLSDPYDYFSRMLNEEGFSDYGGTGSARDYFTNASSGLFTPQFDVYGPVTLPEDQAYYGANVSGKDGMNATMMVVHACEALDSEVDFSQYDRDGDGMIDNVFLFYAGLGESGGGGANAVWPHSADTPYGGSYDGKVLRRYGCTCEWVNRGSSTGRPDGIGAFCHEFGHILGLPDLYVTTTVTPEPCTPGAWALMDRGSYNNDGCTPPELDLFSRYALDWWQPQEINHAIDARLKPLAAIGSGYIIRTTSDNEYFLIENRQRSGWDRFVPGHGLLVWHVDYDPGVWAIHTVNNNPDHQHVDILEADNTATEASRSGDTFPGDANVTSLTSSTTPGLVCWSGVKVDLPLTDITELPDGTVTFKVKGGAEPAKAVTATAATDITPRSFTAHWDDSDEAQNYRLRVSTSDGAAVPGYDFRNVGNTTSAEVIGLEPDTRYRYTVMVETGYSSSPQSNEIEALTGSLTPEYIIPDGLEASDISNNGFTATWSPVEGATSYEVTIESRTTSGTTDISESFDNKSMLWNSNSSTYYSSASYVGKDAPSLRMVGDGFVATPVMDRGTVRSFSFWHRAHGTDEAARIHVEVYAHDCWALWKTYTPVTDKGGRTLSVNNFPADVDAVRIVFIDPTGAGTLYADDFAAVYGGSEKRTPLEPVVTAGPSAVIDGLDSGTDYFWSVKALIGGTASMASEPCFVHTSGASALGTVTADSFAVFGRDIHVSGAASLYDTLGRLVDSSADGRLHAPASGIYILKTPQGSAKIAISNNQ
ncbi:MAG: M6 family metalloprotease domain-containing protein [Muribaculaceae bacterium]|nr:M6 family metalloprotease domain-containing protein [Muribaculaceae bacterium]